MKVLVYLVVCIVIFQSTVISSDEETIKTCLLPKKTGICRAFFRRYYYDALSGTCKRFTYGGCFKNKNNMETLKECEDTCSTVMDKLYQEAQSNNMKLACTLTVDEGVNCPKEEHGISGTKFFFNSKSGICEEFAFKGCGGNQNHFRNKEDCEEACISGVKNDEVRAEQPKQNEVVEKEDVEGQQQQAMEDKGEVQETVEGSGGEELAMAGSTNKERAMESSGEGSGGKELAMEGSGEGSGGEELAMEGSGEGSGDEKRSMEGSGEGSGDEERSMEGSGKGSGDKEQAMEGSGEGIGDTEQVMEGSGDKEREIEDDGNEEVDDGAEGNQAEDLEGYLLE